MDMKGFESEIAEKSGQRNSLTDQMESLAQDFIGATQSFAIEMFESHVKGARHDNPEHAIELGVEGLKKLKTDLEKLVSNASEIVGRHLNQDSLWPHRESSANNARFHRFSTHRMSGNRLPDVLEEPVRLILGHVGEILIDHGFAELDGPWGKRSGAPRYNYGFPCSEKMTKIINQYAGRHEELTKVDKQIEELEHQKAQAIAASLWDKA